MATATHTTPLAPLALMHHADRTAHRAVDFDDLAAYWQRRARAAYDAIDRASARQDVAFFGHRDLGDDPNPAIAAASRERLDRADSAYRVACLRLKVAQRESAKLFWLARAVGLTARIGRPPRPGLAGLA